METALLVAISALCILGVANLIVGVLAMNTLDTVLQAQAEISAKADQVIALVATLKAGQVDQTKLDAIAGAQAETKAKLDQALS